LVQDGKYPFNTSSFEATILNGQTGIMTVNILPKWKSFAKSLPNPFVTGTQNVRVVVENPINTT
jgi:hypothetical protein